MPFPEIQEKAGKKRKRNDPRHNGEAEPSRKASSKKSNKSKDGEKKIQTLENGILESRRNYNDILELVAIAKDHSTPETSVSASVSLCRIFGTLMASGSFTKSRTTPESELVIVKWLKSQYAEYTGHLLGVLCGENRQGREIALELIMRLVKEETVHSSHLGDQIWKTGIFANAVRTIVGSWASTGDVIDLFVRSYLVNYDDVRYWTFSAVASIIDDLSAADEPLSPSVSAVIKLLLALEPPAETKKSLSTFHGAAPENQTHGVYSLTAHKKAAQKAWLAVLQIDLTKDQRKSILSSMTETVVPWFLKVDLLMDFLTSSYEAGGATSLLALSGLFHLIQERNLDYPSFYSKLYSLLDNELLHSKHRSRFFRLLDTFMGSTHLPAQLVASFIKRLARLALQAPPAGIVVVVPWIYNMLKSHPQCTFMIHRENHDPKQGEKLEAEGMDEPFDMGEADPMMSDAIESSLWEIETLQSHYHPNVATLAKIISEQFTKQSYNIEDFLDHSYNSLIEVELGKDMRKSPVLEWQIPKRIFVAEDGSGLNAFGTLLERAIEAA